MIAARHVLCLYPELEATWLSKLLITSSCLVENVNFRGLWWPKREVIEANIPNTYFSNFKRIIHPTLVVKPPEVGKYFFHLTRNCKEDANSKLKVELRIYFLYISKSKSYHMPQIKVSYGAQKQEIDHLVRRKRNTIHINHRKPNLSNFTVWWLSWNTECKQFHSN